MGTLLNRINENINQSRTTLIGYLPIGFPDPMRFRELVKIAFSEGVDIMELGIPYEDPYLDGEVIQNAYKNVLSDENDINRLIEMGGIALETSQGIGFPIVYSESVKQFAEGEFFTKIFSSGYHAVLVPNITNDQQKKFFQSANKLTLGYIGFVSADANHEEILEIANSSSSFLYLQGVSGSTGQTIKFNKKLVDRYTSVKEIANEVHLPVLIGFGIRNADDIKKIHNLKIDGAILGTSFVREALKPEGEFRNFVRELYRASLNGEA